MKILHILYSGLGGHGNVFFSFIKADENRNFTYEAIFAGVEDIREEYVAKSTSFNISWKFIKKQQGLDLTFSKQFVNAIKNSNASVIFLHGSRFIVLAKIGALLSKHKKKIVVRETQANHLKTTSEWVWLGLAMLLANHIIFLTEAFKEEIKKKLSYVYFPKKISTINNGMDLEVFAPVAKTLSKTVVLGMQSRIIAIKDHATLLNAFALVQKKHPELLLQLKIAGDGDLLFPMQQLAKQLQLEDRIIFTGMLNEKELIFFMQSLDIYIHASLGETMSTALMQAMACKLPIIASDVAGINNMIMNNKTGILVPVKNVTALANAINTFILQPATANEMKAAAYAFAQLNYSNTTMFLNYALIFENMKNN